MCGRRRELVRAKVRAGAFGSIVFGLSSAIMLLGIVVAPRTALAASSSFALSWSPSQDRSCVSRERLHDAIVARLGRNPFVDVDRADVVLDGRELPPSTDGRQRARVDQRNREGRILGSRELDAASCAELEQSAAFVIVLIVDHDALLRETEAAPKPPQEAREAQEIRAPRPTLAVERPQRPSASRRSTAVRPLVQGGLGLGYGRGLLPGGDLGGVLTLGLSPWRAPVHFEWRGSYRHSLGAPHRRHFDALIQEWRACYGIGTKPVIGGAACAGGAWGAIFPGTGGLTDGDQAAKAVYGPVLALAPTLRAGAFAVVADVSLFFPRPRWAFSYEGDDGRTRPLYELDRTVLTTSLSLSCTF